MNQTPELLKLGQLFVAVVAVPGRCAFTRSGKPICVAYRPINGNSSRGSRNRSKWSTKRSTNMCSSEISTSMRSSKSSIICHKEIIKVQVMLK